jgi:hypothetical protein
VIDVGPYRTKATYQDVDVVWRGGSAPTECSLAWAMEPYTRDDYREAAARLERRLRDGAADAPTRLYLGVSRFLMGEPAEAEAPLREVARGAGPEAREGAWYLALVLLEQGETDEARRRLESLRRETSGARRGEAEALLQELPR